MDGECGNMLILGGLSQHYCTMNPFKLEPLECSEDVQWQRRDEAIAKWKEVKQTVDIAYKDIKSNTKTLVDLQAVLTKLHEANSVKNGRILKMTKMVEETESETQLTNSKFREEMKVVNSELDQVQSSLQDAKDLGKLEDEFDRYYDQKI